MSDATSAILLFDGVCELCDQSVQFVLKRDPKGHFKFASLQSQTGKALLKQYHLSPLNLETMVLIENGRAYTYSTASLRVVRHLSGAWSFCYGFILVPPCIRNAIYRWVARNRYRWFGKKVACRMPTPDERARFLDI